MGPFSAISRFAAYYRRNGLLATLSRARVVTSRTLFSNRMVLLCCDLQSQVPSSGDWPGTLKLERKRSEAEINPQDLQDIASSWVPKLVLRNMRERFALGSSLWVIKSDGRVAGYCWTIQGRTVLPYYVPLGKDDVHFFDLYVFPQYRGRAMNWFLIMGMLQALKAEGCARAYAEIREWNRTSQASFTMTPFTRLGWARKATVLGRTLVWWTKVAPSDEPKKKAATSPSTGRQKSSAPVSSLKTSLD